MNDDVVKWNAEIMWDSGIKPPVHYVKSSTLRCS